LFPDLPFETPDSTGAGPWHRDKTSSPLLLCPSSPGAEGRDPMQCQPGTPLLLGAAFLPELGDYFGDGQIPDSRLK